MGGSPNVLIISSYQLVARAAEQLLRGEAGAVRTQIIRDLQQPEQLTDFEPDILIVAPINWRELNRWLPPLQRDHASYSWLVLAPLPVAGMFATLLKEGTPVCTIAGPGTSPDELRDTFLALTQGRALCAPQDLVTRFTQGLPTLPNRRQTPALNLRELECGCAVSLGLSNRGIARALHLSEETTKTYVGDLLGTFGCPNRRVLGQHFERAMAPLP
jgi:DNA-binding NarL/FixJ family response regulator